MSSHIHIGYIAYPVRLEFWANERKHSVDMVKKWTTINLGLTGNIKAIFNQDRSKAVEILINDIKKYINTFPDVIENKVRLVDFSLIYSCNEIDHGKVWIGGVVSDHFFKE